MNIITEDKQRRIDDAIRDWKREYKNYRFWVNFYLWLIFIPFFIGDMALFQISTAVAYIGLAALVVYVMLVIFPSYLEWSKINRCNLHNIHNIKIGVIRRKYYKQRQFSVYLLKDTVMGEIDKVRATELQFNKFKINDKIIYFEFFPGEYAVTYLPPSLKDLEVSLSKNDAYTPTLKDIDGFARFRKEITLYDNYLTVALILITFFWSLIIGVRTNSIEYFALGLSLPTLIIIFIYTIFVRPQYPFKISEIENCFRGVVIEKNIATRTSIRRYYHGKTFYYIRVIDFDGEEYNNVRVLKRTYEELNKGDNVICFDYKAETMMMGGRGAIKDIN